MRTVLHVLTIEGLAYRLRPVRLEDADFIVRLRRDPRNSRFIHHTSASVAEQEEWIRAYFQREGDLYFIIESRKGDEPVGTIGVCNVDLDRKTAEWGRWIVQPGSRAGLESAWLVYQVIFERLGLESCYQRVITENGRCLSFHERCGCGMERVSLLPANIELNGVPYDVVELRISRDAWRQKRGRLLEKVEQTAHWLLDRDAGGLEPR